MATENILVKVLHKSNSPLDYDSFLKWVWRSDNARPWDTYSRESFRRFWDITVVEHRSATK